MYIIINTTTKERVNHEGNWPEDYLVKLLLKGDDVLVISTYSNTLKELRLKPKLYGDYYVDIHAEYHFPIKYIKEILKGE